MSTNRDSSPAAPTITRSQIVSIGGNETTAGTVVNAYKVGDDSTPLSSQPAAVAAGYWYLTPDTPLNVGDSVYAKAFILLPDGTPGDPSPKSASHSVTDANSADKPSIEIYTGQYFEGSEATPGTLVNLYNGGANIEGTKKYVMNTPVQVENGSWSMFADNPVDAGAPVMGLAYWPNPDGFPVMASGFTAPVTVDPNAVAPVPPGMDNRYADMKTVSGTTFTNTYVTLTVSDGSKTFQPLFSPDGNWSFDVGPGIQDDTTFSATANYLGGVASGAFTTTVGHFPTGIIQLLMVAEKKVRGTAPAAGMTIMGWRASDGKSILNYPMSGDSLLFETDYLTGMTLQSGDLLYAVAVDEYGTMTSFDSKPEGYGI